MCERTKCGGYARNSIKLSAIKENYLVRDVVNINVVYKYIMVVYKYSSKLHSSGNSQRRDGSDHRV